MAIKVMDGGDPREAYAHYCGAVPLSDERLAEIRQYIVLADGFVLNRKDTADLLAEIDRQRAEIAGLRAELERVRGDFLSSKGFYRP